MDAKVKGHGSVMDHTKTPGWLDLSSLCIIRIRYDSCSIFYDFYLSQLNGSFDLIFEKNKYPRCIIRGENLFKDLI